MRQNIAQQITKSRTVAEAMFAFIRTGDRVTVYQGAWTVFLSKYREVAKKEFDLNNFDEKAIEEGVLEYAKRRYKTCKECPEFNNIVKVCTECYCFMPAKVLIKEINCPLGRWKSEV